MSELRETMRDLRLSQPTRSEIKVAPPSVWVRLVWDDLGILVGRGAALCHPRDTFDRGLGIEIAYGRAVKDAAQNLLEMTRDPEGAPSAEESEEMGPGYLCFQCEHYEPSRRNPELGLCHEAWVFVQYSHMPACETFRLREEEPPEDAGDGKAPGLEERVQALESDLASVASLVQNMHLDALPAVYRRLSTLEATVPDLADKVDGLGSETRLLTKRVGKLEALERFDERRATYMGAELDGLRGRMDKLESGSHDHMA